MYKVLDERFNENSGFLERVILTVGNKSEDGEPYFWQLAEVTVEKQFLLNGDIVHAEILYDYTKLENDVTNK